MGQFDAERGDSGIRRLDTAAMRQQGGADDDDGVGGCCAALITFFSVILIILTFPISVFMVVKQVQVNHT